MTNCRKPVTRLINLSALVAHNKFSRRENAGCVVWCVISLNSFILYACVTRLAQQTRIINFLAARACDVLYQIHIMSLYRMRESVLWFNSSACIPHALAQKYIPSLYSNASRRRAHKAAHKTLYQQQRVRDRERPFFVCCTISLAFIYFHFKTGKCARCVPVFPQCASKDQKRKVIGKAVWFANFFAAIKLASKKFPIRRHVVL